MMLIKVKNKYIFLGGISSYCLSIMLAAIY